MGEMVRIQGDGSTGSGRRRVAPLDTIRYEDIARQLLMQIPPADIASNLGMDGSMLGRILKRPAFLETFERVKHAIYMDVDATIMEERLNPLLRARSQAIRAQTTLAEVLEECRTKIANGDAKAMVLKVAAETAFGIIDRSGTELARRPVGVGGPPANVTFNFNAGTPEAMKAVIAESGVDLSDLMPSLTEEDVLDGEVVAPAVDAPTPPAQETPAGE